MTTENNKLIAEFMGYDVIEPMQYHTSWDWLMPVAHKIKETDLDFVLETGLPIDDVYKSVVEFIKKYNNIKEHKKEDIKNEIENFIIYHCGSNDDELTYLLNCLDAYIDNDHIINE